MKRNKTILLLSHCLLNQNTVFEGEARAMGVIPSAVNWAVSNGYGLYQLPCPEFSYLGLGRPGDYDYVNDQDYPTHCQKILIPVVQELKKFYESGYRIAGLVGIQNSPSCDPARGIFMEQLFQLLSDHNITVETVWQLPNTEDPLFDPNRDFVHQNQLKKNKSNL